MEYGICHTRPRTQNRTHPGRQGHGHRWLVCPSTILVPRQHVPSSRAPLAIAGVQSQRCGLAHTFDFLRERRIDQRLHRRRTSTSRLVSGHSPRPILSRTPSSHRHSSDEESETRSRLSHIRARSSSSSHRLLSGQTQGGNENGNGSFSSREHGPSGGYPPGRRISSLARRRGGGRLV